MPWEIDDPSGRTVHMSGERWKHIIDGHPELAGCHADLLRAIVEPSEVIRDSRPGEDWYYLAGAGPSRWLKVVVSSRTREVITAFPRRRKP